MKVNDLIELACAILNDSPNTADITYSVHQLNMLLQDCLDVENSILAYKGAEQRDEAQRINSIDDEIEYDDSLVRAALPYGLAEFYYRAIGDARNAQDCKNNYESAKYQASKYSYVRADNYYGTSST